MNNLDWIRSMSAGDLADYIGAVYTAGKMCALGLVDEEPVDYVHWLYQPADEAEKVQ